MTLEGRRRVFDAISLAVQQENSHFATALVNQALLCAINLKQPDHELVELADTIASWLVQHGHMRQAEQVLSSALSMKELAFGSEDPRVMQDLERLAWFRSSVNRRHLQPAG